MKKTTVTCDRCGDEMKEQTHQITVADKKRDLCDVCRDEYDAIGHHVNDLRAGLEDEWFYRGEDNNWPGIVAVDVAQARVTQNIYCTKLQISRVHLQENFYIGHYHFKEQPADPETGKTGYEVYDGDILVGRIAWKESSSKDLPPGWNEAFAWDKKEPGVIKWNGAAKLSDNIVEMMICLIYELENARRKQLNISRV